MLYAVLGGTNNMWGPALGATIMTLLPEFVRGLASWRPTAFGLAILVLLLIRPDGLLAFRTATLRVKNAGSLPPDAIGANQQLHETQNDRNGRANSHRRRPQQILSRSCGIGFDVA